MKKDFSKLGAEIFYKHIYPIYAKEFLFGNDYEKFAQLLQKDFILSPEQWEAILYDWEQKEAILRSN